MSDQQRQVVNKLLQDILLSPLFPSTPTCLSLITSGISVHQGSSGTCHASDSGKSSLRQRDDPHGANHQPEDHDRGLADEPRGCPETRRGN